MKEIKNTLNTLDRLEKNYNNILKIAKSAIELNTKMLHNAKIYMIESIILYIIYFLLGLLVGYSLIGGKL